MRLVRSRPARGARPPRSGRLRPLAEPLEARELLSGDLQVSESPLPLTVAVNQPVQYSITASNFGQNTASGVMVVEAVPENFRFVTSSPSVGIYDPNAHLIYFNLGTLKGASSQTVNVTVVPTQVGAWSDWTSIYSNAPGSGGISTTSARITALPSMPPQADVGVNVAEYPSPQSPGSPVTYNFDVSNYGPNTATGTIVTDALPPTFTYQSSSGGTYDPATNSVIFRLGSLAFGQDVPLQVVAVPNNAGDYTNWVDVRSSVVDTNETNNDAYITTSVHGTPTTGIADLSTYQNVANTPNNVGASNTYHMHVQNLGAGPATGVVAVDYLPYGVTYTSSSLTGAPSGATGVYNAANNSVSYSLGTMAAGQSIDIDVMVNGAAQGTWANRMLVRSDQQDVNPNFYEGTEAGNGQEPGGENLDANNMMNGGDADPVLNNLTVSPYSILPSPLPNNTDLQVTTTVTPNGPVAAGTPVTYNFLVSNNGSTAAPSVILTDILASSVLYRSSSPVGMLSPTLGLVTFDMGNIPGNGNATAAVTVVPTVTGSIDNLAIVRPGIIDNSPGNNTSEQSLNVVTAPQPQSVVWYGVHRQPTSLGVTYNQPMDPATAGDAANYSIVELGRRNRLHGPGNRRIAVRAVTYLADQQAAIVYPSRHLDLHRNYALLINGSQPGGVKNIYNVPLLDNQTFTLGGQYVQGLNYWYSSHLVPEVPGSPFAPPATTPTIESPTHYRARLHRGHRG